MPISTVSNGESGSSVRTKINSVIAEVNALGTAADLNVGTTAGTVCAGDDSRLSDSREWTASTISQAEAEAGTSTTRRAFTAERVFQAIAAWWATITASALRTKAELGGAATLNVGTTAGTVCAGDDSRLSNARTPTAHAASHTNGTDDIQNATAAQKGLMTAAYASKLDGIEAGAQVNVATNLSYTAASRLLESSTGTDVTLPLFASGAAGLVPASGGGTTNFLRADGTFAAPASGSGKILQVLQTTLTSTATVTGSTFGSVISLSITPASTSSRIMVLAQLSAGSALNNYPLFRVTRGGSVVFQGDTAGSRTRVTVAQGTNQAAGINTVPLMYIDSPASTSSQSYAIEMASHSTGAVYLNRTGTDTDSAAFVRGASSLILIEIDS
jgi:hypothetical protein